MARRRSYRPRRTIGRRRSYRLGRRRVSAGRYGRRVTRRKGLRSFAGRVGYRL